MTNSQRQPYVKGGVASLRQPFFLGKIAKKIGKGLKKIVKSPIGKAALIGGGLYGLNRFGIPGMGGAGKNWWSKGMGLLRGVPQSRPGIPGTPGLWGKLKKFGLGKSALIGGGILGSTLPFLGGDEDEDEIIDDWSVTPSSIANIRKMARAQDPSLAFYRQQNP